MKATEEKEAEKQNTKTSLQFETVDMCNKVESIIFIM